MPYGEKQHLHFDPLVCERRRHGNQKGAVVSSTKRIEVECNDLAIKEEHTPLSPDRPTAGNTNI